MIRIAKERILVVIETILRSKSFTIIFLGLMIFSATMTAIILVSNYVEEEAEYIASKIVFPQPPITISIVSDNESLSSMLKNEIVIGCLKNVELKTHNNSIYLNAIVLNRENIEKLGRLNAVSIKTVDNYTKGIIIPVEISRSLNIKLNDTVYLTIDNNRIYLRVIGLYYIKSTKTIMPIIVFTKPENLSCQYKVIITHSGVDIRYNVLYNVIADMDSQIGGLTFNWLALFSIVYLVLSFLLVRKFIEDSRNSLKTLIVQGLNVSSYMFASFLIITLIINSAGMGLGLITVHGVVWVIRFLGLLLPIRPSLTYDVVVIVFMYSIIASLTAWALVKYSLKGSE